MKSSSSARSSSSSSTTTTTMIVPLMMVTMASMIHTFRCTAFPSTNTLPPPHSHTSSSFSSLWMLPQIPSKARQKIFHTNYKISSNINNPNHKNNNKNKNNNNNGVMILQALGGNYLEDIDNSDENGGGNNQRWGTDNVNSAGRGMSGLSGLAGRGGDYNNGGGNGGRGGGGAGTAIRPPTNTNTNANANTNNNNGVSQPRTSYGPGGGVPKRWGPQNNQQMQLRNKVVPIRQPQELLDFVIQDERLSVIKVYASWCKTCQIFDIRYRKLASQIGDKYDGATGTQLVEPGRVRFAEMQFDDPNNEEMCRLLNATKLPYILMYKGSRGKVADFQCGPSNFQTLIDEVNEHMDQTVVGNMARPMEVEEQEWSVGQDQEQLRQIQQQQQSPQSQQQEGGVTSNMLKRKDEEIARLYVELSTVRNEYDEKIATLTDIHTNETNQYQEELDGQMKDYEEKIDALTSRIKELEEDMATRDLDYRSSGDAANRKLKFDMEQKEKYFEKETSRLSMRIAGLEEALLQSKKELKAGSEVTNKERMELKGIIAGLEEEQSNLNNRIEELEAELMQEKRMVVSTAEQASRVMKELEQLKAGKDEEREQLVARIQELEAEMANRENQSHANEKIAMDIRREVEELKREHELERELMAARIVGLEKELSFNMGNDQMSMEESAFELRQESNRLAARIADLEQDIEERDRLLRTKNKATDIILNKMDQQKRKYERELDRTNALANELEGAISSREEEMSLLQEKFSKLERMTSGLKGRDISREGANQSFSDEVWMSEGETRADAMRKGMGMQGTDGGRWKTEREARILAEREVSKLMELVKEREEEVARLTQDDSEGSYQKPRFGSRFAPGRDSEERKMNTSREGTDYSERTNYDETPLGDADEDFWKMDYEGVVGESVFPSADVFEQPPFPAATAFEQRFGANPNVSSGIGEPPSPSAAAFEQRLASNPIVPAGAFGASRAPSPSASRPNEPVESRNRGRTGQVEDIWKGAPVTPPSPSVAAFEQRLAENPIVPDGAFGASRPTSRREPAMRSTTGAGRSDNIRAGAGSASSASSSPYASPPSPYVNPPSPVPQLPTPAMAFEQRLAANPIVPSGAFGASKPTANFFNKFNNPATDSSSSNESYPGSTQENSRAFGNSAPAGPPAARRSSEEDPQSKWAALDEAEKKRVAAEAYKAFEKQLNDRRNPNAKPSERSAPPGRAGVSSQGQNLSPLEREARERKEKEEASRAKPTERSPPLGKAGGGPGVSSQGQNLSPLELERKKHQEMVAREARERKEKEEASRTNMGRVKLEKETRAKKEEDTMRLRKEQEEKARMQRAKEERVRAEQVARLAKEKKEQEEARLQRAKEERARAEETARLEKERQEEAEKMAQAKKAQEASRRQKEEEARLKREKEEIARAEEAARLEKERIVRAKKEEERRAQTEEEEARLLRAKEERAKAEKRLQLAKEERAQRQMEAKLKKDQEEARSQQGKKESPTAEDSDSISTEREKQGQSVQMKKEEESKQRALLDARLAMNANSQDTAKVKGGTAAASKYNSSDPRKAGDRPSGAWINRVLKGGK